MNEIIITILGLFLIKTFLILTEEAREESAKKREEEKDGL
jgi:hypothetical protein